MTKIFYGWYIVAASIGLNFYLTLAFGLGFNVFFLPILQEFGWSRALTSGAFSLRAVESGLLAPVVGVLVDRWGPRVVILLGVIIGGAGMIMLGFIDSLFTFYIAFLIASFGMSGATHGVSWVAAVANWFRRTRGRALGIAMLGPVLGGPSLVIIAVLEGMIGWRIATIVLGIGLWIVGIPLAMVARARPEPYGYLADGDKLEAVSALNTEVQDHPLDGATDGYTVAQAVRTQVFWVVVTLYALMFVGISGLMVHLIPLMEDLNYSATQAASILGLMFFLSGIGRIGSGVLADMLDYRVVMGMLIGFQIIGLLIILVVGPEQYWLAVVFALTFGIGFGGTVPLRPILMMKLFGARSFGTLQGMLQIGFYGSGVIGPVLYGWVFDSTGTYDIAILTTLATILMTIPLTYLLRSPQGVAEEAI
jgi:MFS family permease